jgi:hypothetical protein
MVERYFSLHHKKWKKKEETLVGDVDLLWQWNRHWTHSSTKFIRSAWFSGLLVSTKCHLNTSESRWFLLEQAETVKWESTMKWESTFKKDAKIWWNVTLWPLFSVQQLTWTHWSLHFCNWLLCGWIILQPSIVLVNLQPIVGHLF